MRYRRLFALAALSWPPLVLAQPSTPIPAPVGSAGAPAAAPPVLSTVPTPPEGSAPVPSQMSGLPLQVGDLPPGTVAVRLVRPPFENVANHPVELHVGDDNRVLPGQTGPDGRARFADLRIGDRVFAATIVDGRPIESQRFELPAQGGVRVLLVAGDATSVPASVRAALPGVAPGDRSAPSSPAVGSHTTVVLLALFMLAGGGVAASLRRRKPKLHDEQPAAPRAPTRPPADLHAERDRLFNELVRLELEAADPHRATHRARREALMASLERVYEELDWTGDLSGRPANRQRASASSSSRS